MRIDWECSASSFLTPLLVIIAVALETLFIAFAVAIGVSSVTGNPINIQVFIHWLWIFILLGVGIGAILWIILTPTVCRR